MNSRAVKTQDSKKQSATNGLIKLQNKAEGSFQFADNRPETIAQRKLQESISNNPTNAVTQLAQRDRKKKERAAKLEIHGRRQRLKKEFLASSNPKALHLSLQEKYKGDELAEANIKNAWEDACSSVTIKGASALANLASFSKSNILSQNFKDAKKFCHQGGVGRHLVPPEEFGRISNVLIAANSKIIKDFNSVKRWTDLCEVDNATKLKISYCANSILTMINVVIDGVNKAWANVREWRRDGNEAETDGVQPQREIALPLFPLWAFVWTFHRSKKRGYLVRSQS